MADSTILGMLLDIAEDDPIATVQPLCGLVIIKALDEDGEVAYMTAATPDLMTVECLGMARYAVLKLENGLTARMNED
jgi:hypothetical protein